MITDRQELLESLRRDAYRHGRFVLASGRESDFFIDCKPVMLSAKGHRLVGALFCEALLAVGGVRPFEAVAGVVLGGCPLASAVALTSSLRQLGPRNQGWDALYVRKEPKRHGTGRLVEGAVPAGARVALLEDVLTTGGSSRVAIEALRADGYVVDHVFALVDRAEGATEALAAVGVEAQALFHRNDFVR